MKKIFILILASFSLITLLTGCLSFQLGGGAKNESLRPTTGQQLIDLQKAKDSGAITDAEYQTQKAAVLNHQ